MSEETVSRIGRTLEGAAERDAIHIAVFPALAGTKLYPGQAVKLQAGTAWPEDEAMRIGIIDPFLKQPVYEGQRAYVFMNPGSITSLRHEWTHVALDTTSESVLKAEAERWMRHFAEQIGLSYERTMRAIKNALDHDDTHVFSYDTPTECYEHREEMWEKYAILTGATVKEKDRTVFSCSC